ncbi:MAG TPA: hypothetical protein VJ885_11745 [Thermoanaerobaculia bacterium]|nr:hypothetical protein [Thermoanaerobaculia bacterium]
MPIFLRRLAAVCALLAAAASGPASATDLQILCPEGARVRLDGADAGVCREVEAGRYLSDLAPGEHVVEIAVTGSEPQRYEIELEENAPSRLDAREAGSRDQPTGNLYLQCVPQRCTMELAGVSLENDEDDLRVKEVPVGRYVVRFQRGKKTLEAVAFVKEGVTTGVRADFLGRRAGVVSASEIPSLGDTRWGLARNLEMLVREWQMWDQFHSELRRMEAQRKGEDVNKQEER